MLGGLWEFPGGKIENNESLELALKREIKEECGIIPIIKDKIGCVEHSYSHFSISLYCFHCIEGEEKIQFSKKMLQKRCNFFKNYNLPFRSKITKKKSF